MAESFGARKPFRFVAGGVERQDSVVNGLSAVAEGEISPLEGAAVMALVEQYRRTIETSEIEKRIAKLEARK